MTRKPDDKSDLNRLAFSRMHLHQYLDGIDAEELRKLNECGLLPEYLWLTNKDFRQHYKEAYRQTFNKPCPTLRLEERPR